jgi:hypothetical protein
MKKKLFILILVIIVSVLVLFYKTEKYKADQSNEVCEYVYEKKFMSEYDFNLLKSELEIVDPMLEKSLQKLPNLYRYNFNIESTVVKKIIKSYEEKIKKLVANKKIYLANNFPIEYRKYVKGSFMNKHKDEQIYKIPQYECVLTISNTTDSKTIIGDHQIKSEPNSIIILKANGIEHEVTKVNQGERKFLKFIFTETDMFYGD